MKGLGRRFSRRQNNVLKRGGTPISMVTRHPRVEFLIYICEISAFCFGQQVTIQNDVPGLSWYQEDSRSLTLNSGEVGGEGAGGISSRQLERERSPKKDVPVELKYFS